MSDGYKRQIEIDRLKTIDSWRQTRLISYLLIKENLKDKNMSMYEFYPLPDDPTREQQEQARKEEAEREGKWQKSIIEQFRQRKFK